MGLFKPCALALSVFLCGSATLNGQAWVDEMMDPNVNFYTAQQSFNQYWQGKQIEKGKGFKQFKRWEWFMEPRVFPSGVRFAPDLAQRNYDDYLQSLAPQNRSTNGSWTSLGPVGPSGSGGGAGRINCIRFDPSNPANAYAGAPAGGLWKTTNSGSTWTLLNTDNLGSLGISDIAVHPANSNIIFIATGDVDGTDTYSIGILKSTDGGSTWASTGLSWTTSQGRTIRRLLIDPTNAQIMLAATSNGIYRSTDGGATWLLSISGGWRDMEFKPGDPNTVYIASASYRYSTDGGVTFTTVSLPVSNIGRVSIAVTPANSAYVYLLASDATDNGFGGVMRSTNSGTSFTTMATSPNLLGWSSQGTDQGGQGWYDLALGVSQTNANELMVGGVNVWRSTNGGTTWAIRGHWTGGGGADLIHADQHDIAYYPGSGTQVWLGCDGGVYRSTNSGSVWTDVSNSMVIAQMYRLGVSQTNAAKTITGWQDNGTNLLNTGAWNETLGGDGMECIISHTNSSTQYGSLYYGEIHRTTNNGGNWNTIVNSGGNGVDSDGEWVTPYIMSPTSSSTLYVGKSQVYKTTNSGTAWAQVGSVTGGSGQVIALAATAANANYLYVGKDDKLWVTTNGTSFTDRTNGLPTGSAAITYIAVSNTDANKVWVTFSGFSSGNKVYMSTDAGVTWVNYSTGLPNIPANCITYQNGTANDGVYVGMDIGVYYRDNTLSSWILFNTGLPNTVVTELDIQYSTSKLRASTYGRGLWESDLFSLPTTAPVTDFTADAFSTCEGQTINFSDISQNLPTAWSWNFGAGAIPSTSTAQHPSVQFTTAGNYTVTLTTTNAFGNDTEVKTAFIVVQPGVNNNLISADQVICTGTAPATLIGQTPTGGNGSFTYQWQRSFIGPGISYINLTGANAIDYTHGTLTQDIWFRRLITSDQCSDTSNVVYVDVLALPTPVIQINSTLLTVYGGYSYQWFLGGTPIAGAVDSFHVAQQDGLYTVTVTDTNGCSITSSPLNVLVSGLEENTFIQHSEAYPNPNNGWFTLEMADMRGNTYVWEIQNLLGQVMLHETVPDLNGLYRKQINLDKNASGCYFLVIRNGNNKRAQRIVVY
ncbi:MAG: PKD domain-containing protein [Flavobacteriales bacterium]